MKSFEEVVLYGTQMSKGGRLDSMLLAQDHIVYLVGSELTVMMKFDPVAEVPGPVSFYPADYAGKLVGMVGGAPQFYTEHGAYKRYVTGRKVPFSWGDVHGRFLAMFGSDLLEGKPPELTDQVLPALSEGVSSYVEFEGREGALWLVQRNLATGGRADITAMSGGLLGGSGGKMPKVRRSIRTKDLVAALLACSSLRFDFSKEDVTRFSGAGLRGVISNCVYDGLLEVK
jgi:hypothetical protein